MANIFHLVQFSNRETQSVLRALLKRAQRGEVSGVTLCFRSPRGTEHFVFTDAYKANPAAAVNAAQRMCREMLRRQDPSRFS